MAESTPFLNLYKPGGGSSGLILPDEVVDIDRINANMDLIDTFAQGHGLAANRNIQFTGPAAALAGTTGMKRGDTYQETDDDFQQYTYDGAGWVVNASSAPVVSAALAPAGSFTIGNSRLHRLGRLIVLDLSISKATDIAANELMTTISAPYRPVNQINTGLHLSSGFGFVGTWSSIGSNGEIRGNAPGVAGVRQVLFSLAWVRDA